MESLGERNDNKQYEKERKRHRRRTAFIAAAGVVAAALLLFAVLDFFANKDYTDYEVLLSHPRQDSSSVRYAPYGDGILKYSKDGASGIGEDGEALWNGSYEMSNPQADVCGDFVVIGDIGGKEWYVYNGSDTGTRFQETLSIVEVQVGRQGIVAVVLEDRDSNEIHLYNPYDAAQPLLATIPTNVSEDGYPMDIGISEDGKKLVTSYFCVQDGAGASRVSFYNFGEVGKDKVNRIVGGLELGGVLAHKVEFLNNDTVCILTEAGFSLYSMEELPEEIATHSFEREIRSVLLGDSFLGVILEGGGGGQGGTLEVYGLGGSLALSKELDWDYDEAFAAGDDIVLLRGQEGLILRKNGSEKFRGTFPRKMDYVFPAKERNAYLFIDEKNIEKVRLSEAKEGDGVD